MTILYYTLLTILLIVSIISGILSWKNLTTKKALLNKLFVYLLIAFVLLLISPLLHSVYIVVGIFALGLSIFYVVLVSKEEVKNPGVKVMRYTLLVGVAGLLLLLSGLVFDNYSPSYYIQKENAQQEAQQKAEDHANAVKERKERNREKNDEKRQANIENANYSGYTYKLEDMPKETNNVISKAFIDKSNGNRTTIVVNEEFSSLSGDVMKRNLKALFDKVKEVEDSYNPLPSKYAGARTIVIKDSYGNDLAHSSFFTRSVKYDFE